MTESLQREIAALRLQNQQLELRIGDAEQATRALARGEVDAVAFEDLITPVLLQAAQESSRRHQKLLRAVFDGAREPMVLTDARGKFVDANVAACELYGLGLSELTGRTFVELGRGGPMIERPDGATGHEAHLLGRVDFSGANGPRRLEYGSVSNVAPGLDLTVMRDVTDRENAEIALRESEKRYRRIVETTSDGIWILDADLVTTFMNARMVSMLGYTPESVVGLPMSAFMDEAQEMAARGRLSAYRQGMEGRGELSYRRKDGTSLWTSHQATPLTDSDGRFEGVLVVVTDASSQRRSDEARARLAAIVESSEDAIMSVSLDGVVTSWNRGAEKLYQYSVAEMPGKSVFLLVAPADWEEERKLFERVARGEAIIQYETKRFRKDGSAVEAAITLSPIRNEQGVVVGLSKIGRDLTARRQTELALGRSEELLRQSQKMDAVGRLAGGIAHDFNNLLTVILSYTNLALDGLKAGDPLLGSLGEIQSAGDRAAELTRQLLAFSRQQILQPRVVDLAQIVSGMQSMLARLLGEDVELNVVTSPDLGRVIADPGQIEQVIMNLAVNARDAMPDGGRLRIETANVELEDGDTGPHMNVAAGRYVMLAVSDNGMGMDVATRARVFEPFFTTKAQGTGLGLSTVFGIVEQSEGHVSVYSEPGHGCIFRIYLRRTERVSSESLAPPPLKNLRGSETILLVEDEDQVRAVALAILRRNGYHVLETSNGGEAFLVSTDFEKEIHLLLTDVVMPRMNGRKLAEKLAVQRPDMKVLFASGYTDDTIVQQGLLDAGMAFLQKPFTPAALLRKVREVLDRLKLASAPPKS